MQPFYVTKVIGQPFAVKFNGEIISIDNDTILAVGDVFSVPEGKNAWFVLKNGEQIDVLNQSYIISTKGNIPLDTSAILKHLKNLSDNDSKINIKTEELVQHGLSNEQANALILKRYEEHFTTLAAGKKDEINFEPQVYRISENQHLNINVDELSTFVIGAKLNAFTISSITFLDKECEITYDSDHFIFKPHLSVGNEINIKVSLTNGLQNVTGELIFVVQPSKMQPSINLVSHTLTVNNLENDKAVADIIAEGFDKKTLEYSVDNDPNHYFFTIENDQLFLTKEGVKAISNQTLSLDEMQVTIRARDHQNTAEKTIEIPIELESKEQSIAPSINEINEAGQGLEIGSIQMELFEHDNNETEEIEPATIKKELNESTIESNIAMAQDDDLEKINKEKREKIVDVLLEGNDNTAINKLADNQQNLSSNTALPETVTPSMLTHENKEEKKHTEDKEKSSNTNGDHNAVLKGFNSDKRQKSKSDDESKKPIKQNIKSNYEAVEKITKERKLPLEKNPPAEPNYFHLNKKNMITEHIANFIPTKDSINLTAILALSEKKNINKHLYIEKDTSGAVTLNISPSGDGEINTQYVFDDININKLAQIYQLNISNLSDEQISHVIIDSMLKNANLTISTTEIQTHRT